MEINQPGLTSAGRIPTYALCSAERWGMRFSDLDPERKGKLMFPVARDYAFAVESLFEKIQWGNTFFGKGGPEKVLRWPIDRSGQDFLIEAIKPLITKAMTDRPEAGGMPGKAVPQAISLDVAQSSASEQGFFDSANWSLLLYLNDLKDLILMSRLADEDAGQRYLRFRTLKAFVDTIYHESRHCQQWFWSYAMAQQHPDNFPDTRIDQWPGAVVADSDDGLVAVELARKTTIPDDPLMLASIKRIAIAQYVWVLNLWRTGRVRPPGYLSSTQSLESEFEKVRELAVDLLQKSGYGGTPIMIDSMVAEPNRCSEDYRGRPWENDAFYCGDMAGAYFMQAGHYGIYTHAEDECSAPYAFAHEHPDSSGTEQPIASQGE
ncbi:hypothetical protein F3J20_05880 [Paraburkholderia sp. Cy-641]|uniref:hypothetical protein n=2 Tax=unclassified Paraburkholderia TaxID=2615204 RepID=UPI001422C563|nr:hypothetical protein [Paraburkholderia sp. Cy-641]NIF76932.1 hypothetical protein [Paraburkholderia sp. Cy-641]